MKRGKRRERKEVITMTKIIVWKYEDNNTTPRGFGFLPTYHLDKPYINGSEIGWTKPIECTLPDGYTIGVNDTGITELYDAENKCASIIDYNGHPAITTGLNFNKQGVFAIYKILDK